MLLVLWVIRLLNGADITPGGQEVGFDCVIEFCPPPPLSYSSSFSGSWEEDSPVAAGRSGRGACLWFQSDHKVFPLVGHHGDPFKKMCACLTAECACICVYVECEYGCVCLCVFCVCAPVSHSALCCAVTCSQISQRIYHPLNCLWVVDKMAPIHSHMKMLRG